MEQVGISVECIHCRSGEVAGRNAVAVADDSELVVLWPGLIQLGADIGPGRQVCSEQAEGD
jgi:hypothetical protein